MINYFADPERSTPFNLAVGRMIVATGLTWKMLQYDWAAIPDWPVPLVPTLGYFRPDWLLGWLPALAAVALASLFAVFIGYRLPVTTFVSAFLVSLLGTIRYSYQVSHSSELLWLGSLLLLFFGLYAEEDKLSVDELRRTGDSNPSELAHHLQQEDGSTYPHSALKWSLLLVASVYFQAGLWKLLVAPFEWIQPESLGRFVLFNQVISNGGRPLGAILLQYPALISAAAIGTIVLEFGFLPVVLARRRIGAFVFGLVGMHLGIAYAIGPIFTLLVIFLLPFAPWDRLQRWLQPDETLRVVYDENCYFCARSLSLFPYLDANDSVEFYSQRTAPDSLLDPDANFENAMFAFRGESGAERQSEVRRYRGYHAFRAIFHHLGLLAPLSWVMALPVVSDAGERVYAYVAANRSGIATYSMDGQRETEAQLDEPVEGE